MPAKSKQQQRLFAIALSVKRGDRTRDSVSSEVLDIVDNMTEKDIKDFASTDTTGLPQKKEHKTMKKSELRQLIREELGKELNEAVNYPTQYEAEALAEWMDAMSGISLSGTSGELRKAFNKAEDIRLKEHERVFGPNSPWILKRGSRKFTVEWDDRKAEKLGL